MNGTSAERSEELTMPNKSCYQANSTNQICSRDLIGTTSTALHGERHAGKITHTHGVRHAGKITNTHTLSLTNMARRERRGRDLEGSTAERRDERRDQRPTKGTGRKKEEDDANA